MTKLKKNTHLPLSFYLSICQCTLIFPTLSFFLSLFTFAKMVLIQIRPEWSFVNLKICACDRKYAKCHTQADAHDKMGFQYISISIYIVRFHARIHCPVPCADPPSPDFVVQKPMRTRSISKYHFQYRYIFFDIRIYNRFVCKLSLSTTCFQTKSGANRHTKN